VTPEQEILRDAFLAELWRPCREWHTTRHEKAEAADRNVQLAESCGEPELPFTRPGLVA
jgi:hypothetical protein